MSWTKLDDTILTNPKMLEAEELCPLAAPLLWFKALIYTNQQGLDGFVPDRMIARLLDGHKSTAKAADALKTVGLWDRVEGGIQFHNFAKHNLTKWQREEKAQKNREDQQRYRDRNKSADTVRPYAGDDKDERKDSPEEPVSASRAATHADARPQTRPVPTQPNPSRAADAAARPLADPMAARILAGLEIHPSLSPIETVRHAETLAGRAMAKGSKPEWVSAAIADLARDAQAAADSGTHWTSEHMAKMAAKYVDNARAPKADAPAHGDPTRPDPVKQHRNGVQQGSAGPGGTIDELFAAAEAAGAGS